MDQSFRVGAATKEELQHLAKHGTRLALASGRPYFAAQDLIEELSITGPCVFFAGALVIDPSNQEILLANCLSTEQTMQAVEFSRRENLYCELYTFSDYFIERNCEFADIHAQYLKRAPQVTAFDGIIGSESFYKVVIMSHTGQQDSALVERLEALSGLRLSRAKGAAHPNIYFSNLTSVTADKHSAFQRALNYCGVTYDQVIAFGDSEADIPFLQMAGVGIAMGNAPESVKNAATLVTKTVAEDGVAYALCLLRAG